MSIETVEFNGPVTLLCDQCPTFKEFRSFKKAVAFKKKQIEMAGGWRSALVHGQWKDYCPMCCAEYARSRRRGG